MAGMHLCRSQRQTVCTGSPDSSAVSILQPGFCNAMFAIKVEATDNKLAFYNLFSLQTAFNILHLISLFKKFFTTGKCLFLLQSKEES